MTTTLLNTPGFFGHGAAVWRAVAEMCARNGWNADGLIALIEHESGWSPAAKNPTPGQTATGLIQFTAGTAQALGTTVEQIRGMSALDQLPLVERFFQRWAQRNPIGPWDFMVFGLGAGGLPPGPLPDSGVLYPAGSQASKVNPGLVDPDGAIRVGSIRRRLEAYARKFAHRPRITIGGAAHPGEPFPEGNEGHSSVGGLVGVAAALAQLAGSVKALREELTEQLADIERELSAHMASVREAMKSDP